MSKPALESLERVNDAAGDRNFARVRRLFAALGPLSGPLPVVEVTLAAGDNTVEHDLGYPPKGRIIVFVSAAVDLYDKDHANPGRFVTINASGACTVRLLFF